MRKKFVTESWSKNVVDKEYFFSIQLEATPVRRKLFHKDKQFHEFFF